MADLVDLDLDNGHARVLGFAGVHAVSFVTEPSGNGGVEEVLDHVEVGDAPIRVSAGSTDERPVTGK